MTPPRHHRGWQLETVWRGFTHSTVFLGREPRRTGRAPGRLSALQTFTPPPRKDSRRGPAPRFTLSPGRPAARCSRVRAASAQLREFPAAAKQAEGASLDRGGGCPAPPLQLGPPPGPLLQKPRGRMGLAVQPFARRAHLAPPAQGPRLSHDAAKLQGKARRRRRRRRRGFV